MNNPRPPVTPITINHNITVRIVNPVKPPMTPKLSFRTVGAAAVSCALLASEALPFVDNIHANGIIEGIVKGISQYLEQQ